MKKNNLILIVAFFAIAGCYSSSNVYKAEKTKDVDFKKYKTFAWLPTKDTAYTKFASKKNVENALAIDVMQQLTNRGMKLDTLNPDCLFTYTLVMNNTYEIGQQPPEIYTPQSYAPVWAGQSNVYYYRTDYGIPSYSGGMAVTTFRDGSLVIDMIDTKDNKIVWRTTAQGKQQEQDRKGVRATVREIVPAMFKKFPVKQN
jgi:hypothetical protein